MGILKKSTLKLLYCYSVCFIIIFSLLIYISSIVKNTFNLIYFDQTYTIKKSLKEEEFFLEKTKKGSQLNLNELEKLRQEEIQKDKNIELMKEKKILLQDITSLVFMITILIIHYLIIRKTKE